MMRLPHIVSLRGVSALLLCYLLLLLAHPCLCQTVEGQTYDVEVADMTDQPLPSCDHCHPFCLDDCCVLTYRPTHPIHYQPPFLTILTQILPLPIVHKLIDTYDCYWHPPKSFVA